jgi:hypothetical protein
MNSFSSLFKKEHMSELILAILLIIYLIMGSKTPQPIAVLVNSLIGKIILFFVVVYMFLYSNPILAVLFLFVVFDLISRSNYTIKTNTLKSYLPSEEKKSSQFTAFRQFPYTLEQEVVKKMAPIDETADATMFIETSYVPLPDKNLDCAAYYSCK